MQICCELLLLLPLRRAAGCRLLLRAPLLLPAGLYVRGDLPQVPHGFPPLLAVHGARERSVSDPRWLQPGIWPPHRPALHLCVWYVGAVSGHRSGVVND